tara:strand:+ start:1863 stop:2033 length:171 start_codon:yes stop_codon:yes gene_type:complete
LKNLWNKIRRIEEKTVRARTDEGQFVADDKTTPNVNEAYTTVKVKKKKRGRPKKKK